MSLFTCSALKETFICTFSVKFSTKKKKNKIKKIKKKKMCVLLFGYYFVIIMAKIVCV